MQAWYVVGTEVNGSYGGYSVQLTDYRSGENLFGLISLNFVELAASPAQFMIMSRLQDQIKMTFGKPASVTDQLDQYVQQYLAWVTAHEVGHQLGLRHNFMGHLQADGNGSIMDYLEIFLGQPKLELLNIQSLTRAYDLKAIEYGYRPLPDEMTGLKHPQLSVIAAQSTVPWAPTRMTQKKSTLTSVRWRINRIHYPLSATRSMCIVNTVNTWCSRSKMSQCHRINIIVCSSICTHINIMNCAISVCASSGDAIITNTGRNTSKSINQ